MQETPHTKQTRHKRRIKHTTNMKCEETNRRVNESRDESGAGMIL